MVGRLIKKVFFMLILISASMAFVLLLPVNRPDHYLLASIDKEKLLQNTSSPKIIIIGGSNTVYNIDCREISRAIGLPVVNMGLHAGLGLHFMLNEVEPHLQAGDIVLIMPEYDQFFDGMFDGSRITLRLVTLNPSTLRYIRTGRQLLALLKGVGLETRSKLVYLLGQSADENTYSRHAFNEFGDLQEGVIDSSVKFDPVVEDYMIKAVEAVDPACIRDLNRFQAKLEKIGARVYLDFPPVPQEKYPENSRNLMDLCDYFDENLKIPLLLKPGEVKIPANDFYDTFYHLNSIGKKKYTAALIDRLEMVW